MWTVLNKSKLVCYAVSVSKRAAKVNWRHGGRNSGHYQPRHETKVGGKILIFNRTTASVMTESKRFPKLVYCTEISNIASIHTTFPSKYLPWRWNVCQRSQSLWKHSWKPFLDTFVTSVVAFAVKFSALANRYPFRTPFSHGNKRKSYGNKSGEYGGCSKAVTLCLARHFLSTKDHWEGVLYRENQLFRAHFFRTLPFHCIHEVTEDLKVHLFFFTIRLFGIYS
jgi:hypothetical protein